MWDRMGLEPIEIASEDAEQTISIKYNVVTGELAWTTRKMDGVQALGVMANAMHDMFKTFIKDLARPAFSSGKAGVAIKLERDKLTVGLNPLSDPTVLKGVIAAALWEVIERSTHNDQDRAWIDLFVVEDDNIR
jgi:hypothetical protein